MTIGAINKEIMEGDLGYITSAIQFMRHCLHYSPQRIQKHLELGLEHAVRRYDMCHKPNGRIAKLTPEYKDEFGPTKYLLKDLIQAGKTFKSASHMLESFDITEPTMEKEVERRKNEGIIGMGTMVNHHFIGRTVIQQRLRFSGYLCYELGSKLKAKDFIEASKRFQLDVIGISLMANTNQVKPLNEFKRFIDLLDSTPLEKNLQIMVGGQAGGSLDEEDLYHPNVHVIKQLDMAPYLVQDMVKKARK